jgi:hypothetical protein
MSERTELLERRIIARDDRIDGLELQFQKALDLVHHADNKHAELQTINTDLLAENIILDGRVKTRDEQIAELRAELAKHEWVSVEDGLPEDNQYLYVLMIDAGTVNLGCYCTEKGFEWWSGSYCNLDDRKSQKSITHWKPITLPEQEKSKLRPGTNLPECRFQYKGVYVYSCGNPNHDLCHKACSKRCDCPEQEVE